ncbi:MAG: cytochrome oxidase maturation protein Cbb3 [Herminiimonas sp.]|nr:cytochrome oxidase maturation protein Cbb3 [Herminiimonas sp.]
MEALFLLIPLSIGVVFVAIWLFFRMSDSGQFDDMVGPAWRILQDDDSAEAADKPPGVDATHKPPRADAIDKPQQD